MLNTFNVICSGMPAHPAASAISIMSSTLLMNEWKGLFRLKGSDNCLSRDLIYVSSNSPYLS